VAKSNKYSSKVPALADYKPSWLNEDGEITNVDAAIKAVHTLMVDKAKAQDAREDALAENKELVQERDELQEKVDDKNSPDAQVEIKKANDKADKAEAEAKKERDRADRLEVAMEKGLTPAQAKRLQGENKEELEADADEILELFGQSKSSDDDENEDDDEVSTTPKSRVRLTNGGDHLNGSDAEPDYEKIAAEIGGDRVF
jgi:hypothetical protein